MSIQNQIDTLVGYQAADWYEYFRTGYETGTAEVHRGREAEFVRWLTQSPRNIEALLAIASEAPILRDVLQEQRAELPQRLSRLSAQVTQLSNPGSAARQTNRPVVFRSRVRWIATAAVIALTAIPAVTHWFRAGQHLETQVGEHRTVQLNEGSTVTLNALSRIDVRFDSTRRDITLTQGEATFRVAQDPTRPFRVHVSGTTIEAIGTQFNVYARPDGSTMVSVLEGRVRVSASSTTLSIGAGEEALVSSNGVIAPHAATDIDAAIAWQQRKLVFKRTPLAEMAAQFNRYNKHLRIRLEGIGPDQYRVNASFDADDPQSLADLLAREPELSVERREGEIIIRQRHWTHDK